MTEQNEEAKEFATKWVWMTDYCKKMLWNPHDSYFWKKAEEEYEKVTDFT